MFPPIWWGKVKSPTRVLFSETVRGADGDWQEAIHLDAPINSRAEENWPRFSPDGKFLFFSSNRREGTELPDLYWVSTGALLEYDKR